MKKGSLKMAEVKIMVLTIMIIFSSFQFFLPCAFGKEIDFPFKFLIDDMEDLHGWKVMDPDVVSLELSDDAFEGEHSLHIRVDVEAYVSIKENTTGGFDEVKKHVGIYMNLSKVTTNLSDYDFLGFYFKVPTQHCHTMIAVLDIPPSYLNDGWAKFLWKNPVNEWTLFYMDLHHPMIRWNYSRNTGCLYLYFFPDGNLTEKSIDVYIDCLGVVGRGLHLHTSSYRKGTPPGGAVHFVVNVRKTLGEGRETFDVEVTGEEYGKISIFPSNFTLSRGESKDVEVHIELSHDTPLDHTENLVLRVASRENPAVYKEIELFVRCEKAVNDVDVDYEKTIGEIKPVWKYTCQLPERLPDGEMEKLFDYMREAGITCVRIDVPIHIIFPVSGSSSANPDDPSEYNFTRIDRFLSSLPEDIHLIPIITGVPRVLSSNPDSERYHRYPPADMDLYGEVVKHIVMHFTRGWANGFYEGDRILYWEIWNEPNLDLFWEGSAEEYFRLYETIALKIKEIDSSFKVGGPTTAGVDYPYLRSFLDYMESRNVPVDVVDFHHYSADPMDFSNHVKGVRNLLSDYPDYQNAVLSLSEWNCPGGFKIDNEYVLNSFYGALFTASALIGLMQSEVDIACHFNTIDSNLSFPVFIHGPYGIFFHNPLRPKPSYYVFKMFNEMGEMNRLVQSSTNNNHIDVVSGKAENGICIIINDKNYGESTIELNVKNLPWDKVNCEIIVFNQSNYDGGNPLSLLEKRSIETHEGEINITFKSGGLSLYLIDIKGITSIIPGDIHISRPENALYISDKKIIPFFLPIVIGGITIEVTASIEIEKVDFYIDGSLRYTDSSPPFSWKWDEEVLPGLHHIKVIGYDKQNSYTDEKTVIKIF